MPQVINTNIASLNAQRNLNKTQGDLQTAMQRLSSGMRINSAKDDAAGLAISNRMTSQIQGMNQAARNANDAISLAQTGEGGLNEITNNLHRMRELAVQSRNATNTDTDRESLDAEFQQLLSEVDRIAETTAFNGRNVLDGSLGSSVFQVGANVGETISVDVSSSMRTDSIGNFASVSYDLQADGTATNGDTWTLGANGDLTINNVSIDAATDDSSNNPGYTKGSAVQIASAINAKTSDHGVTAKAGETTNTDATASNISSFGFTDANDNDTLTYTLSINGQQIFQQGEGDAAKTASELASDINGFTSETGVTATVNSDGDVTLTHDEGGNIEIKEQLSGATSADTDKVTGYFGNTVSNTGGTTKATNFTVNKASLELTAGRAIQVDFNQTNDIDDLFNKTGTSTETTSTKSLENSDIKSVSEVDLAINRIDEALEDVDNLRGTFGAIQSRFESTIASLETTAENVSAARSRIRDADFAAETASLTKAQILQQAGISMVSQANQLPQQALSLLQ